jgi:hypothetical protein
MSKCSNCGAEIPSRNYSSAQARYYQKNKAAINAKRAANARAKRLLLKEKSNDTGSK